jgi:ribonucleoside-diphosphate reductase alpha chain
MVENGKILWEKLRSAVRTAVHFLDNVIDINNYPMSIIAKVTKDNRKIGLGIMGFAEALIKLGIPYDSEEALKKAEEIMSVISKEALKKSQEIAEERGSFPNFKESIWDQRGYKNMRNASLTTIAPTGSISIIAGCSSGIEPLFAVSFIRNVLEGTKLLEVNPLFGEIAKKKGFYSEELMMEIAREGSIKHIESVPDDVKRLFVTAMDISPEWHVKMQAVFQKYIDNAVSKTINLPNDASVEDVRNTYLLAHKLKCKGITVYRYGSKKEQVLYLGSVLAKEKGESMQYVSASSEYSGGCPDPQCNFN